MSIRYIGNNLIKVRAFSTSKIAQGSIVKDLFIKEVKGYKPSASTQASDIAQAKEFKLPTPPQAPTFDEDISAELSSYDEVSVNKA